MLQTRSGRCPNCKESVVSGADRCPTCGLVLDWERINAPARPATARPAAAAPNQSILTGQAPDGAHAAVRLLAYFVGACLLVMLAMTVRGWFFSSDRESEMDSPHAVRVQDAESFRTQIFGAKASADSPEAAYILGIAMPAGSDVLQITVSNEWKTLDYATRLAYATRITERWKSIHAPARSYFSLLDEAGEEIGGRGISGKVWVKEKHETGPARKQTTRAEPAPETPAAAQNAAQED